LFEAAVLTSEIPVAKEKSLYTRFGDLFAQACAAASLALVLAAACGRYAKRNINRRNKK
jgi:apolipoprotein N-acyltransferase